MANIIDAVIEFIYKYYENRTSAKPELSLAALQGASDEVLSTELSSMIDAITHDNKDREAILLYSAKSVVKMKTLMAKGEAMAWQDQQAIQANLTSLLLAYHQLMMLSKNETLSIEQQAMKGMLRPLNQFCASAAIINECIFRPFEIDYRDRGQIENVVRQTCRDYYTQTTRFVSLAEVKVLLEQEQGKRNDNPSALESMARLESENTDLRGALEALQSQVSQQFGGLSQRLAWLEQENQELKARLCAQDKNMQSFKEDAVSAKMDLSKVPALGNALEECKSKLGQVSQTAAKLDRLVSPSEPSSLWYRLKKTQERVSALENKSPEPSLKSNSSLKKQNFFR